MTSQERYTIITQAREYTLLTAQNRELMDLYAQNELRRAKIRKLLLQTGKMVAEPLYRVSRP